MTFPWAILSFVVGFVGGALLIYVGRPVGADDLPSHAGGSSIVTTGIACVSCEPERVEASGWVGTDDVGDALAAKADRDGRVWLCSRHLNPIWNDAKRGARLPLPGQEVLFP